MYPLFLILFFGLPISTVAVSVFVNLGSPERAGNPLGHSPRKECELKYPGMGTSAVSTRPNTINNLATWTDREAAWPYDCGNVDIDGNPGAIRWGDCGSSTIYPYQRYCLSDTPTYRVSEGCGLYCYANVDTCADTQIPNSVAHESSGSIKAINNFKLIKEVAFECKPGFYKVGAVGGKIQCTGTTYNGNIQYYTNSYTNIQHPITPTWTQSQCVASLDTYSGKFELNPNVFLFSNYDGGQLNIVVDKKSDAYTGIPNIFIGVVSHAAVQVVVSGSYAHTVAMVRVSAPTAGSVVRIGNILITKVQIGNYGSQFPNHFPCSQSGCAEKEQTVAAFNTAFRLSEHGKPNDACYSIATTRCNVQRMQCQYATWGGKTFRIAGQVIGAMSITPMTCPGSMTCPPNVNKRPGCPTDTPTYNSPTHPMCSSFSSNSCGAGKHLGFCRNATCTVNECCESNPTCGMFFNQNKCGAGKTMKSNSSGIVCVGITCTVTECCQDCPAGKIQKEDECQECAIGKYNGRTGMTSCVDCESGTFADTPGSSFCSKLPSCTPGSRKNAVPTSTDYCTSCTPGQFSSSIDAAVCRTCPIGFSQPNTASTYCIVSSFFIFVFSFVEKTGSNFFFIVVKIGLFSWQKTTQHRKYDVY